MVILFANHVDFLQFMKNFPFHRDIIVSVHNCSIGKLTHHPSSPVCWVEKRRVSYSGNPSTLDPQADLRKLSASNIQSCLNVTHFRFKSSGGSNLQHWQRVSHHGTIEPQTDHDCDRVHGSSKVKKKLSTLPIAEVISNLTVLKRYWRQQSILSPGCNTSTSHLQYLVTAVPEHRKSIVYPDAAQTSAWRPRVLYTQANRY